MSICVENLSKQYGAFQALKNFSFKVKEGECAGLLGPNGAGKSTTIKILTGQLQPSSGSIKVLGMDPIKQTKELHSLIGYVPDNPSIYDELTVRQNIEIFRQIYREQKENTQKIIQKMGLTDKTKIKGKNLSKGLKQKLLIARTLVHTPKFLFLDEPTVALDPNSTDFICQILEELKDQGVTIFLSTHLMYLAERLCDHIILLNEGEKKEEGSLKALRERHGNSQLKVRFLEEGKQKTIIIPFSKNMTKELMNIEKTREILSLNTNETKLEDIFIRLVRGKSQ